MSPDTARISEIIDRARISPYQILILTLCFLIALLDGFDTAIIGYIAPALREEWGLQPSQLSPAFGAGLFGLLIGSLLFGPIADAIGRKRVLLVAVLVFGGCTLASAYTQSIESLTLLRFITGIGLGGAIPTCITLSSEYSPARRRMLMVTLSWSGFTAGLALGGLLAGQIIPAFGWRGVLLVGGIAPLALLMDRIGPYRVLAVSYLGAALVIGATGYLMGDVYTLAAVVFLIGFGVAGAQNGLNLVSATLYPTAARVTGVSWAMANGRFGSIVGSMLGAWMMTAAGSAEVFFLWLALPALLGAVAIFLLYRLSLHRRAPLAEPVAGA
ncbi:MFS transporter [Serratia nevei]|uniref:MFS transporter n=1 Tax=Serratia nevei TaxID=2703794 RepID=UPI003821BC57